MGNECTTTGPAFHTAVIEARATNESGEEYTSHILVESHLLKGHLPSRLSAWYNRPQNSSALIESASEQLQKIVDDNDQREDAMRDHSIMFAHSIEKVTSDSVSAMYIKPLTGNGTALGANLRMGCYITTVMLSVKPEFQNRETLICEVDIDSLEELDKIESLVLEKKNDIERIAKEAESCETAHDLLDKELDIYECLRAAVAPNKLRMAAANASFHCNH